MKIKKIGSNQTELHLANGTIVLFSYETPVAAFVPKEGYLRTKTKWSTTTTKHINKWLRQFGYVLVCKTDQSELDALAGGI